LFRSLSTATAEAVCPAPFDDLDGASGDEPFVFTRPSEIRIEIERSPIGGIVPMRNVDAPTCGTVENSEKMGGERRVSGSAVLPDSGFDHVKIAVCVDGIGHDSCRLESAEPRDGTGS
jgi:hypothetical protein